MGSQLKIICSNWFFSIISQVFFVETVWNNKQMPTTAEFVNSKLLHHEFFRMGLNFRDLKKLQRSKIMSIVFVEVCFSWFFVNVSVFFASSIEYSATYYTSCVCNENQGIFRNRYFGFCILCYVYFYINSRLHEWN